MKISDWKIKESLKKEKGKFYLNQKSKYGEKVILFFCKKIKKPLFLKLKNINRSYYAKYDFVNQKIEWIRCENISWHNVEIMNTFLVFFINSFNKKFYNDSKVIEAVRKEKAKEQEQETEKQLAIEGIEVERKWY